MKKLLLSLGAAFLLAAGAQAQVSYGLKAGVNLPKLTFSGDNITITSDVATNFYVSGYANIFAAPNFAIQPGLSLQGKGAKFKNGDIFEFEDGESATINLMSIEIPVNAVYYIPAGTAGSVFIGAGPYVGFNVAANGKSGGESEKIDIGSGDGEINTVDYGANFQAGFKLSNGFLINAGYGLGLGNVWNLGDGVKTKNNVLSFGIGFEF